MKSISLVVGLVMVLGTMVAGCAQAPPIPHRSEGLVPVDCLACHELGLKGATKIPEGHLDGQGEVKYDSCGCHKPAPVEEETAGRQGGPTQDPLKVLGLVVAAIALSVMGVFIWPSRPGQHMDT